MNAGTTVTVIEAVGTVIALAGVIVSFWFSWRGQQLQRRQAEAAAAAAAESNREAQAAAQRAAAAAALTIDELTRIADGIEAVAREAAGVRVRVGGAEARVVAGVPATAADAPPPDEPAQEPTPAPSSSASWSLSHDDGDHYRLSNTGTAIAHDVWVGGSTSLEGPDGLDAGMWIAPGSSVSFTARVRPTTTDSTITVTWAPAAGGGDRSTWRYPLPEPPAPAP
jgi:hypothetical protein